MSLKLFNTLGRKVENFEALNQKNVSMYSCGPTVYDYAHIGNFRSFLNADLMRRFLEFKGYNVHHVMNITDVGHMTEDPAVDGAGEDKMLVAARRLKESKKSGKTDFLNNPNDPFEIAAHYTKAFIEDAQLLNLKVAFEHEKNMPKATDKIAGMQKVISKLLAQGSAYIGSDKAVYFDVSSIKSYGELSGNSLEDLQSGAGGRVSDQDQSVKKDPADFLLWKPDSSHLMKWPSPWGEGYPGWHIECSVMALENLGKEVIDIHTGGEDLVFPHHECEIAQSCAYTGQKLFAKYWMHTRFLLVNGEKMSKSKGNFYTARDVLEGRVTGKAVDADVLRFELLKTHYRQNANFTEKGILDSAQNVRKIKEQIEILSQELGDVDSKVETSITKEFEAALDDDLNMSAAIAVVLGNLKSSLDKKQHLASLIRISEVLGLSKFKYEEMPAEIEELKNRLNQARANRDYKSADSLRDEIISIGYEVRITAQGVEVKKKLA